MDAIKPGPRVLAAIIWAGADDARYDSAMAVDTALLDLAAAWGPQRPGRLAAQKIADALVEPDWDGVRVVAALAEDGAVLVHAGEALVVPAELPPALVQAFSAVAALVEGVLTTKALQSGEGVLPPMPGVERPPILVPRAIRGNVKDDPYVRARDHERREAETAPGVIAALARGERHAFVATDLLWLDGTPLDDVPLLERKRLLDGVLEPSYLVRVTPYVKASAVLMLVTWGTLGFRELHHRAANSRYLAGRENPDCAVSRPPQGPHGPAKAPTPPR
jgi:hypothetical protein